MSPSNINMFQKILGTTIYIYIIHIFIYMIMGGTVTWARVSTPKSMDELKRKIQEHRLLIVAWMNHV